MPQRSEPKSAIGTPPWLKEAVCAYYRETTESIYLRLWSGKSLGLHLGLFADEGTTLEDPLLRTNAELAARLKLEPKMRILDAGCGVGGTAIWLAETLGVHVTGISIEPGQVALAQRFAHERGVADRVSFHCMDYAATTFEQASFDAVYHIESLCHAFDIESYFEHLRWLLDDGGRFGCIECFRGDGGDAPLVNELCEGWIMPSLRSSDEVLDALAGAGFSDALFVDLTTSVLRSAASLEKIAAQGLRLLERQRQMTGAVSPLREKHARASQGVLQALRSNAIRYGYVEARRP